MTPTSKARRPSRPPVAVWLDRSGDLLAASRLVRLEPDDRYHVTDGRVPLTAKGLARCGVLVIAGHGLATYSRQQMDAIARFVRRGGGLLLAGSAGFFERYAGRPAGEMAVATVARRFGIEFLSPGQAGGRPGVDIDLVRGYPPGSIRLRRCPPLRGLRKADVFLRQWSPLRCRRRGAILLAHRRTGEPAAVSVRFGRGRVVAVGGTSILERSHRLCRSLIDHIASGRSAAKGAKELPWEALPPYRTRRSGRIEVRYPPGAAGRAAKVLKIARKLVPHFDSMVPAKDPRTWRIELSGGCASRAEWGTGPAPLIHLGAEAPEENLTFALGACLIRALAWNSRAGEVLWGTVLESPALEQFAGLTAMQLAGFGQAAEPLGAALERHSRRRLKGIDAGWFYGAGIDAPGLWIWRELARRFGEDILRRFFKAVPKKLDRSATPPAVFTQLDLLIHFLSRAAKADLYPWFAALGATVHPLPRRRFGGKDFKRGVRRYLLRRVADAGAAASERADAVEAIIASQEKDKQPLGAAARQLRSAHAALRLAAATRLLRAGDARGSGALEALAAGRDDEPIVAVAALNLVERGRREAGDRLAKLAGRMDPRFQLDAGYQLGRIGHRRGGRFSLAGVARAHGSSAARLETRHRGALQVFPTVNGQHVANIFSVDVVAHMPHNTHFSMLYVDWVHTSAKYRRKGLSRLAMQRTMADPMLRRCACAGLHTGTRNVAHAMYRSFGFVDAPPGEHLICRLDAAPRPIRQKGVTVRPCRDGDEKAMPRLFNAFACESFATGKARPGRPAPGSICLLARRGRRPVGYLTADLRGKEQATISAMALDRKAKPDQTARALISRFHPDLAERGVKGVRVWYAAPALAPFLQPLGYRTEKSGGIAMIALQNLPQFFREISGLLERRLAKTDFSGTVAIRGERHRAALRVDSGRVAVPARLPARADITLSGSDDTITRIVTGIASPFEAYLQIDLRISPMLTEKTQNMLEALFPRLEVHAWLW